MRVLVEGRSSKFVWQNIELNKSRTLLFFTLLALAFMLFAMNRFPYASIGVILIPISYAMGVYTYRKKLLWESGEEENQKVAARLDALGDDCTRISGVRIPPNHGDADHIVLAPNGIFVFEVKNASGVVECAGDEWRRYKVGRGGGRYEIKMGNPSRQAKRNAKTLKDLLLANQQKIFGNPAPHIWVHAAVVLPDDTEVRCENPTVDVIKTGGVAEYVKGVKAEREHPPQELARMGGFLLKNCS